jgi:hypothetical protein
MYIFYVNFIPVLKDVYGHQDLEVDYADLPLDAQMNYQADALATMELDEYSTCQHSVPFDPESRVMLWIDGISVTRRLETTIRTKARLPILITYYKERLHWDDRTFHAVNWDVFGSVYPKMKSAATSSQNFVSITCPRATDSIATVPIMTTDALLVSPRRKLMITFFSALPLLVKPGVVT